MTEPLKITDIVGVSISAFALIVAITSAIVAWTAYRLNNKTYESNLEIFRRQHVFNLFEAWAKIPVINMNKPDILYDLIKVSNVLILTASAWKHDFISKDILYEIFWDQFKVFYKLINGMNAPTPPLQIIPSELVEGMVSDVYKKMEDYKPGLPSTAVGPSRKNVP